MEGSQNYKSGSRELQSNEHSVNDRKLFVNSCAIGGWVEFAPVPVSKTTLEIGGKR